MIYLDTQASTPIHPEVSQKVLEIMNNCYANPHSQHSAGQQSMHIIDISRRSIADHLGVQFSEIIFTSGATESNNLAIQGVIKQALTKQDKVEIITTPIEHSSVIETIRLLENDYPGRVSCKLLPIDATGVVKVSDIESLLTSHTVLVSIIHANNEIGTIQPIRDIGRMLKKYRPESEYPLFHSDGAQAIWSEKLQCQYSNLDLYSISGHKMYAPKGIGALYMKKNTPIQPIMYGGGQEYNLRPGTLNTPLIAGLGYAFSLLQQEYHEQTLLNIKTLRNTLLQNLLTIEGVTVNGDLNNRLPHNINIYIPHKAADEIVIQADLAGLAISAGSACHSGSTQESYVIQAIAPDNAIKASHSIRLSLSQYTTEEDIQKSFHIIKSLI